MLESVEVETVEQAVGPTAPPRRRRLGVFLLVLALIVVITASVFAGLLIVYDPLQPGSLSGTPVVPGPYEDSTDDETGEEIRSLTYVHGGALGVLVSVRNDGPWGITITGVGIQEGGLFRVEQVRRGVPGGCCTAYEPFAPFSLQPGEERPLELLGVMNGCGNYTPGSGTAWNSYRIEYRILGVERTRDLVVRERIEINIPSRYVCPEGSPGA